MSIKPKGNRATPAICVKTHFDTYVELVKTIDNLTTALDKAILGSLMFPDNVQSFYPIPLKILAANTFKFSPTARLFPLNSTSVWIFVFLCLNVTFSCLR